ncbi:MAG TPA: sigma 54-interacting transcriptional regulator, partial [Polyangiaceae bacterium]
DLDEVLLVRGAQRGARRLASAAPVRLVVEIPDGHVSSNHARLYRHDGAWMLEDLGSKNGTFVNDASCRRVLLRDGDTVRVGRTFLVFRSALPTHAASSADLKGTAQVPALATLLPPLASDLEDLTAIAATNVPLLLLSETGTGKEVLARAVHALSRRAGPLVAVNCAAIAPNLVEATLFGHRRGAFSGATSDSPGLLRAADGGTLFLDEVGDMPGPVQAALLRALQEGEVLPVGATRPERFEARVIAATHHDLEARVAEGDFREDLFARLAGSTFRLPPLRERREDLGLLIAALLRGRGAEACTPTLDVAAGSRLLGHRWPRNVRELEKTLAHAMAVAKEGFIEAKDLPDGIRGKDPRSAGPMTRERLVELLAAHGGNVQAVASVLATSRSQVHRMGKRLGIDFAALRP